jgi:phosphoribosylformimino-5-aminoimidazole carboxamide ribonucleotide (ProFAR) isomerase
VDDEEKAALLADQGLAGAIVGRALYTGAIEIGAVLTRLSEAACC